MLLILVEHIMGPAASGRPSPNGAGGLRESIYKIVMKTYYMSAGVGFGDLSIDVFLEAQDKRHS